jgi:hypothetical protein
VGGWRGEHIKRLCIAFLTNSEMRHQRSA